MSRADRGSSILVAPPGLKQARFPGPGRPVLATASRDELELAEALLVAPAERGDETKQEAKPASQKHAAGGDGAGKWAQGQAVGDRSYGSSKQREQATLRERFIDFFFGVPETIPSRDFFGRPYYVNRPSRNTVSRLAISELHLKQHSLSLTPKHFSHVYYASRGTLVLFNLRLAKLLCLMVTLYSLVTFYARIETYRAFVVSAVASAMMAFTLGLSFIRGRNFHYFGREILSCSWVAIISLTILLYRYFNQSDQTNGSMVLIVSFLVISNLFEFVTTTILILCITAGVLTLTFVQTATLSFATLWTLRLFLQAVYYGIPTLHVIERIQKDCFIGFQKAIAVHHLQKRKGALIENLLQMALPKTVVAQLSQGKRSCDFSSTRIGTILFFGIKNFDEVTANSSPREIVEVLNSVFNSMDHILDRVTMKAAGVEKIKTIGNIYMVAGGLLEDCDHAHLVILFAAKLLTALRSQSFGCGNLIYQGGVQMGTVNCGIIGLNRFMFDAWGDPINLASRLQNLAPDNSIATTFEIKNQLLGKWKFRSMGEKFVKGKGTVEIFLLCGAEKERQERAAPKMLSPFHTEQPAQLPLLNPDSLSDASSFTSASQTLSGESPVPVLDLYYESLRPDETGNQNPIGGSVMPHKDAEWIEDLKQLQILSEMNPQPAEDLNVNNEVGRLFGPSAVNFSHTNIKQPYGSSIIREHNAAGGNGSASVSQSTLQDGAVGKSMSKTASAVKGFRDTGAARRVSAGTPGEQTATPKVGGDGSKRISIFGSRTGRIAPALAEHTPTLREEHVLPIGPSNAEPDVTELTFNGAGPHESDLQGMLKTKNTVTIFDTTLQAKALFLEEGLKTDDLLSGLRFSQVKTLDQAPSRRSWLNIRWKPTSGRAVRMKNTVTVLGTSTRRFLTFLLWSACAQQIICGVLDWANLYLNADKLDAAGAHDVWRAAYFRIVLVRACTVAIEIPLIAIYWRYNRDLDAESLRQGRVSNNADNRPIGNRTLASERMTSKTQSVGGQFGQTFTGKPFLEFLSYREDRIPVVSKKLEWRVYVIRLVVLLFFIAHIVGDMLAGNFLYVLRDAVKDKNFAKSDPFDGYLEVLAIVNLLLFVGIPVLTLYFKFILLCFIIACYCMAYTITPWKYTVLRIEHLLFFFIAAIAAVLISLSSENALNTFFNYHDTMLSNTDDARRQQAQAQSILEAVLPRSVAKRLLNNRSSDIVDVADVTVVVMDIASFTEVSQKYVPEDLVAMLNFLFSRFDEDCEAAHLEKITTIGDSYVAVCNLPEKVHEYAARALWVGLRMVQHARVFQSAPLAESQSKEQAELPEEAEIVTIPGIRVGIASGRALAALVGGSVRFRYDITSDVMKRAKQLESASTISNVNVCRNTVYLVEEIYRENLILAGSKVELSMEEPNNSAGRSVNTATFELAVAKWAEVVTIQEWSQARPACANELKPNNSAPPLGAVAVAEKRRELRARSLMYGPSVVLKPKDFVGSIDDS